MFHTYDTSSKFDLISPYWQQSHPRGDTTKKIAPAAPVLQLLKYTRQCVQPKPKSEKLPVAFFFTLLIMKIACSAVIHNTYKIQYAPYQKNVLLDGMWERGWKCMDTSRLIFTIGESTCITIEDWGLSMRPFNCCLSRKYEYIKSTMDQD